MPRYEGEERRVSCLAHAEMIQTDAHLKEILARLETNTEWIMQSLKYALGIAGTIVCAVVIPFAVYISALDKRVDKQDTETRAACEKRADLLDRRVEVLERKAGMR